MRVSPSIALCICSSHLTTLNVLPELSSSLAISRSNSTVYDGKTGEGINVPLQSFVNPAGATFSAVTVQEVPGLHAFGGGVGTVDATWFQGYAWRILAHVACKRQVGWRFSLIDAARRTRETATAPDSFDLLIWAELNECEGSGEVVNGVEMVMAAPDIAGGVGIPHARLSSRRRPITSDDENSSVWSSNAM